MKDLTQIDGVAVIERTKARFTKGDTPNDAVVGREISTVDEVLLANEQVIFQCMSPRDDDCTYTAPTAKQVTTHQVKHGRNQIRLKLQAAEAELAEFKKKAERTRANRSAGAQQAAQTKALKRMAQPAEVGAPDTEPTTDLGAKARRVIIAFNAMVEAQSEFERTLTGYMRAAEVAANPPVPEVDPVILEKAQYWDKYLELQHLMNTSTPNGIAPQSARRRSSSTK